MPGNMNTEQPPRHGSVQRVAGMNLINLDGSSEHSRSRSQGGSTAPGQSGSRPGSAAGRSQGSQRGSQAGSPPRYTAGSTAGPGPFLPGLGYDPAVDPRSGRMVPKISQVDIVGKYMDLPADAFTTEHDMSKIAKRPGFNTQGKPILIDLNLFAVTAWPTLDVYQYDVSVSPADATKDQRALVKKVWSTDAVQSKLREATGGGWLWDENKLAWCHKPIPRGEIRVSVNLDALSDKPKRPRKDGKDGTYICFVKQSAVIRMAYLDMYLKRQTPWDNHVLQCINFLDHLMRQYPSEELVAIKRNFYNKEGAQLELDRYLCVRKGTYSAFRLGQFTQQSIHRGLVLNVDIANTAFWTWGLRNLAETLPYMLTDMNKVKAKSLDSMRKIVEDLKPIERVNLKSQKFWEMSDTFKKLRRIQRLKFNVLHRGNKNDTKLYTIKSVMWDPKYAPHSADAKRVTFARRNPDGTKGAQIPVAQYMRERYGGMLKHPELPLIETTRDGLYPMECVRLANFQKYQFKLEPEQTAAMIKIAVTRPEKRLKEIMDGVKALKWKSDPYLQKYGLNISDKMLRTNAVLLQNPEVVFGGGKHDPKTSGRWDLRGKRFIEPNPQPLQSWGFIGCGDDGWCTNKEQLTAFAQNFARVYKGHGGKIAKDPYVVCFNFLLNYAQMCEQAYKLIGNNAKSTPQIIFFVINTRNQLVYERIKKNMDCKWCTMSQVLLADHVKKNNAQYCSNVAMKVNAKLGGATCRAVPVGTPANAINNPQYYPRPTMFIGLDVSHASPGSSQPSMAAATVSMDKYATKWAANCQSNGWRVECVHEENIRFLFRRLFLHWRNVNKCAPAHIYYFRDGVSEGSFGHVIEREVVSIKRLCKELDFPEPRFTVIIATKRHHVRFFPPNKTGDKNANPFPGTLVERDATHPFHFDFFLSSHSAIQGTARPVHYQVILDEANLGANELQRMIYHMCYQYARSTTPVSLFPAIYYAHLTSVRARAHEDINSSAKEWTQTGKAGFPLAKADEDIYDPEKYGNPIEAPPLVLMENNKHADSKNVFHINTNPWFI